MPYTTEKEKLESPFLKRNVMDRFYKLYPENFTVLNLAIRVRTIKDH